CCDLTSNGRRLPGVHSATRGGRASSGAVVHHVYLVPGFFGFANLGDLKYFAHVREYVVAAFARRGLGVHVDIVKTRPTASLTRRAERVVSAMAEPLQDDDGPVHLIGHSSGGLDVRLLLSPGVTLPTDLDVERYARQVRTAVTVATPHHGTPLAAFFTSLLGQKLLQVLSLATISILRFGHLPLSALVQLGAVVARMDGLFGLNSALLDEIFAQLLADFSPERRRALAAFFREVGGDQALLVQLTPEAMEVFNACTRSRPGVRAASVVTIGHPPGIASTLAVGPDRGRQGPLGVYAALHRPARIPPDRVPPLDDVQADVLRTAFGTLPDAAANDGMVPTRSQPWARSSPPCGPITSTS